MDEDFFWGDLLALIRRRELVTVVGPDLTLVEVDGGEQTLTSLIGQRLVQMYRLTPESEVRTIGDAVALILNECGRDEVYRLYRLIYEIINGRDWKPGKALRDLAAITHLRLFVSTTPDRLLAEAINEIRFAGRRETRELSFSPNKCTSLQRENQSEGSPADTVVLSLFGKAESTTPQYAIHDEDLLEWLCALLSESSSFPEWLSAPLKRRSTLFIGYDIPDWIGRYLLRISGDAPLSQLRNQQFFFAGSSGESPLLSFLSNWLRRNMVQRICTEPTAFAEKLHKRWEEESPKWADDPPDDPRKQDPRPAPSQGAPSIFISYMREDADAARRLNEAITKLGGDVWFDQTRLLPGDSWEPEILSRIKRDVKLFVPVISANTERREEGFVFKEWNAAVDRAQGMVNRRFIVPVVIEDDLAADPNSLQGVPADFLKFSFGCAPGGDPDERLRGMLTEEIRNMRSPAA
jgi:hypothetical protein